MKKLALTVMLLGTTSLFAADGAALFGKCVSCHGKDGKMTAIPGVAISGQSAADVEKKLNGYKTDTYGGAKKGMMKGQVASLSADDIKALAEYVATLK